MASEDEGDYCPLCMEELDITDKTFNACPCGYQVCLWCWHQIKNEYNALCPACRAPYSELSKQKSPLDREDVLRRTKARRQKEKTERRTASSSKIPTMNRKNLANVRVMQRNLVYVIGLPQHFADEDLLRSNECFGQYGKIIKAVVNKSHLTSDRSNATASAYITYANKDDALCCIIAIDGYYLDGSQLRASFGTTKYCNFFLRNLQCNNPDCLYLHELGEQDDSFTKDEMQSALHTGKAAFRDLTGQDDVRAGTTFPSIPRGIHSSDNKTQSQRTSSEASFASEAVSADAQRQAQSAAAVHKLRQTNNRPVTPQRESRRAGTYSTIVSGSATPTTRSPATIETTETVAVSSPVSPEVSISMKTNDDRKPNLRVDTSVGGTDDTVGPLEALKLATGSVSQAPAWAQPFPSPSVMMAEQDQDEDLSTTTKPVFSPFGMGFSGGIRSSPQSTSQWGSSSTNDANSIRSMHEFPALGSHDDDSFPSNNTHGFPVTHDPPAQLQGLGSSSFATIDAIFSSRSESSEALAGLLGVQLSATPLVHESPSTAKNTRSSRFAFANQSEPVSSDRNDMPSSPLYDTPANPFGNYGFTTGRSPLPSFPPTHPSEYPMSSDTNVFEGNKRQASPFHRQSSDPFPMPSDFGSRSTSDSTSSASSGLAFLQQMLPNVNISFGEYPQGDSIDGDRMNAWDNGRLGSVRGETIDSNRGSSLSSPFFDPAIVAAPGLDSFYRVQREDNRHMASAFDGFRPSGSVVDN